MEMKLRIRDLREDADLTQRQVAEYLHCDQSLYSKYEPRGERALPLEYAVKLASFYRVSVDYLAGVLRQGAALTRPALAGRVLLLKWRQK